MHKSTFLSILTSLIISFYTLHTKADETGFPITFGEISLSDFQESDFEKEQTSSAIVLCDFGHCYLSEYGQAIFVYKHIRIKILKSTGYHWADIEIPYNSDIEIDDLKACTYNVVGGKIEKSEVNKKMIFKEDYRDGLKILRFAFPNIRRGSIVEYKYIIEARRVSSLWTWNFQKTIPVAHSEYWVDYPNEFKYTVNKTSAHLFYHNELTTNSYYLGKYGTTIFHRFVAVFQKPFESEPYMNSENNYLARVEFHLENIDLPGISYTNFIYSFDKISLELLRSHYFGRKLGSRKFIRDALLSVVDENDSSLSKIIKIRSHLTDRLRWNGENRMTTDKSLAKTYREGEGSSADINLLFIQFLRDAGFDANPLILSTRARGTLDRNFSKSDRLNYVIAHVKTKNGYYLLDATNRFLPYSMLPQKCLNGEGWLVLEHTGEWIPLGSDEKNYSSTHIKMTIDADGALVGTLKEKYKGYDAANMRKNLYLVGEEELAQSIQNYYGNWDIEGIEIINPDNLEDDFSIFLHFKVEDDIIDAGNFRYINPFMKNTGIDNPFSAKERIFPINFSCKREEQYFVEFTIPENYTIYEVPESLIKLLPKKGGQLLYNVSTLSNKVIVMYKLSIHDIEILPDEYLILQKLFQFSCEKQSEMIVLEMKN